MLLFLIPHSTSSPVKPDPNFPWINISTLIINVVPYFLQTLFLKFSNFSYQIIARLHMTRTLPHHNTLTYSTNRIQQWDVQFRTVSYQWRIPIKVYKFNDWFELQWISKTVHAVPVHYPDQPVSPSFPEYNIIYTHSDHTNILKLLTTFQGIQQ